MSGAGQAALTAPRRLAGPCASRRLVSSEWKVCGRGSDVCRAGHGLRSGPGTALQNCLLLQKRLQHCRISLRV